MNKNKNFRVLVVMAVLVLLFPLYQYAYLDPGTGSYLFQVLLAGLLGAGMGVRIFWTRIKAFFTKNKDTPPGE